MLHLTGHDPFTGTLTGEVLDQEKALREAKEGFEHLFAAIYRIQMYLAFVLGEHELVYQSIQKTNMDKGYYEQKFPGILGLCHLYAFNGLSMVSLYRDTRDPKYLKLAKQFASKIKKWDMAGVSQGR